MNTTTTDDSEDDEDLQPWSIFKDCALHDCLATYYKQHPEKNVKVLLLKEQVESIEDLVGTVTQASVNNKQGTNGLDNCGGCGQPVGPVHKSQM